MKQSIIWKSHVCDFQKLTAGFVFVECQEIFPKVCHPEIVKTGNVRNVRNVKMDAYPRYLEEKEKSDSISSRVRPSV